MANPRSSPYLWATWLARAMSGEVACQWQFWFQVHNQLTEKVPDPFDLVGWRIDHTRLLNELAKTLQGRGLKPKLCYHFRLDLPPNATLGGEVDCLVVSDAQVSVFDCKTGHPRASDQIQVMVYMHALTQLPALRERSFTGVVVYKDRRAEIPFLPDTFASNFDYFVDFLTASDAPQKSPGADCRFCPITARDCSARAPS